VTENGCLMVSSIHVVSSENNTKNCVVSLVTNSSDKWNIFRV